MKEIGRDMLRDMLVGGSKWLGERRRVVDEMNVFPVPDGDTGTNMAMTLEKMESEIGNEFDTVGALAHAAARGALLGARGNSGVILSQILKGFAEGLDGAESVGPIDLAR